MEVSIYNSLGRMVKTILAADIPAGEHRLTWDGTDQAGKPAPSGVYYCRLDSHGGSVTVRMVLLK